MSAYYNEIDPFAAAWLRELIKAGMIADGEVDERSIENVFPSDLMGFTQCHFFAGIGGWSYAMRQAGWSDERPVWTGSCPCQPFSAAGKGAGFADERHLWPAFFHLISQLRPAVVFGEQVASKDGLSWLDLVQADLEGSGYSVGAVDTCAAGFGAPHIRQRLYWVADRSSSGLERLPEQPAREEFPAIERGGGSCGMADDYSPGLQPWKRDDQRERYWHTVAAKGVANRSGCPGPTNGFWANPDWLLCRDGKWRPVSASPQPMVDGIAKSLGRVCDEDIAKIEEEINAWEMETSFGRAEALRDLWNAACETTTRIWTAGRIPGLSEATFLLAFLRQLAQQGWGISECISIPGKKISKGRMRVLWGEIGTSCTSHQLRLERQQAGKYSDALRVLSSILARHAHSSWGIAHAAYAESCFPLIKGASNRVGRLRGYGNAINAIQAQSFIESFLEVTA